MVSQPRLLLAWATLEARSCEDNGMAYKAERNDVTHQLERGASLDNLLTSKGKAKGKGKGHFPKLSAEYDQWVKKTDAELPWDLVHSLAFIRYLAIVREAFYTHEDKLCETIDGEKVHRRPIDEALAHRGLNMDMAVLEMDSMGLDVMAFKRINRLRNAFKKQCAPRRRIPDREASKIAKDLNDMCIENEDNFVAQLQAMTKLDVTLDELREDDSRESGKRICELTVNLAQLLHILQKAWFTVRARPRSIGFQEANVLKAACVCGGSLLDIHLALSDFLPSELADISLLPDVG
eukprot:TRINITY_DN30044_c0_g1_i1.p1 TRINITY_DN30044_c0_g1~~TRINITY_DN30044_c0_g1_i1.p1  ORF type:complete len:293 (-),score=48.86 TRINITY_DN30044_c0_g1_i1:138-1016(-)